MSKPNLFTFATKELSQDAFICWLISWANPKCKELDNSLHNVAITFVKSLLSKKNIDIEIQSIEIRRQKDNIDVAVIVNEEYIIIIEDKVFAKKHGNQLEKYYNIAKNELKFADNKIVPIFLKTVYSDHYHNENYELFLLHDFIEVLNTGKEHKNKVENPIFTDFTDVLEERLKNTNRYKTTAVSNWNYWCWMGFLKEVQERNKKQEKLQNLGWGHINNPTKSFWALWTNGTTLENKDQIKGVHLHLKQVGKQDDAKIVIFATPNQKLDGNQKHEWVNKLINIGNELSINFKKVNHLGQGKNFGLVEYQGQVIFRKENGEVDTEKTISVLEKCGKILEVLKERT